MRPLSSDSWNTSWSGNSDSHRELDARALDRLFQKTFADLSRTGRSDGFGAVIGLNANGAGSGMSVDVIDELDVWGGELDHLFDPSQFGRLPPETQRNLQAGRAYAEKIIERAGLDTAAKPGPDSPWLRGVSRDGRLEAAAIIAPPTKETRWLEIEQLATAPWNIRGVSLDGYKNRRGAGTALVKRIALESAARGFDGRIFLLADPNAVAFYEKLGFTAQGSGGRAIAMLLPGLTSIPSDR
jgi:GNAT superfamily N-acetyltransferase